MANQIPLLNAATYKVSSVSAKAGAEGTPENEMIDLFADARSRVSKSFGAAPSTPLRFVAFSDPNDLLSYRLYTGIHTPQGVRVTNILVSNDPTYFGLLERPDNAHCGYGWNPAVIATLAKGYDGRKFGSVSVQVPRKCGLVD